MEDFNRKISFVGFFFVIVPKIGERRKQHKRRHNTGSKKKKMASDAANVPVNDDSIERVVSFMLPSFMHMTAS